MKAITVNNTANFPLKWSEVPDPELKDQEVLVEVHATSVNRADLLQRNGNYPPPKGASPYLGLEVSGVIVSLGKTSSNFSIGDRVCSIVPGGGYAELAAVDSRYLMELPESLSYAEGGALSEVFLTAYVNLFMEATLKKHETVLIHGGASGVGTAAIQMAALHGSKVCVTARSERKLKACQKLGADILINHTENDWPQTLESKVGGVDVILDCVGSDYFTQNISLLNLKGRLVCIATITGTSACVDLSILMRKRLRLIGSVLRTRSASEKAEIVKCFKNQFGNALVERKIMPTIDSVMRIENTEDAHFHLQHYKNIGKIVLMVR